MGERSPSRLVVRRGEHYRHCTDVLLACGHVLVVRTFSRYSRAKALGCPKCRDGKPISGEDVL